MKFFEVGSTMLGRHSHRGVSVLELLITIAVTMVVFGIAAPNFSTAMLKYTLRSAADEIANSIQYARSRAILKNKAVTYQIASDQFGITSSDKGGTTTQKLANGLTFSPSTPVNLTLNSNGTISALTTITINNQKNMNVTLTIYPSGKTKVSDVTGG